MKRVFVGLAILLTLFSVVSCSTVTSSMAHTQPIAATEMGIFTAKAATYYDAWLEAIRIGKSTGYAKVVSETTESTSFLGLFTQVAVTVVMTKE